MLEYKFYKDLTEGRIPLNDAIYEQIECGEIPMNDILYLQVEKYFWRKRNSTQSIISSYG